MDTIIICDLDFEFNVSTNLTALVKVGVLTLCIASPLLYSNDVAVFY